MGLEQRGNNRYYYRKERDGTRIVSTYLGRGETAQLIAQCEHYRRLQATAERQAWVDERATIEAADAALLARERLLHDLITAVLREHGYHQHKGQWRRKRRERRASAVE